MRENRSIYIRISIRPKANTKAKLITTWTLLVVARHKNIKNIMILGDSKCVIDWLKGETQLEVLKLVAWKHKIGEIRGYLREIKSQYIYRDFNKYVDILSKIARHGPWDYYN